MRASATAQLAQNAFGKPAWRKIAFAVWRLGIPTGTAKFRLVIGLCQISWLPVPWRTRKQQIPQRLVELRRHSRSGWFGFAQRSDLQK